ncbi:hypothetical protein E2C01_008447 [Portunus trituberculatus]|uniref:Uncharacterized protein n=1 Tax=Portunus trituberculatus TaxID=210409 RepID=A0A5B7D2E7_PORTR|nr:hypothetical protein [Portunus trituberculatus]
MNGTETCTALVCLPPLLLPKIMADLTSQVKALAAEVKEHKSALPTSIGGVQITTYLVRGG